MKFNATRMLTVAAAALVVIFAAAPPAAADTQIIHDQDTFSIYVPCANDGLGETVEGYAKVQLVYSETSDGAGGYHAQFKVTLRGAGLGLVTGDTYRFHADIPYIFVDRLNDPAGDAYNAAVDYNVDAIGTGSAPTYRLDAHAQITVNANGVVTMSKGDFTINETCK